MHLEETIPQGRLVLDLSAGYGSECTRGSSGETLQMFEFDLHASQEGQTQMLRKGCCREYYDEDGGNVSIVGRLDD